MGSKQGGLLTPRFLAALFVVIGAGWALGFFLRKIQATILAYQLFLVVGCLAGPLGFVPPNVISATSQAGVFCVWLAWAELLRRRTHSAYMEALQRDGLSYAPLLLLPSVALISDYESLRPLRGLIDPLFIICVASVCAIKAWHWTLLSPATIQRHRQPLRRWAWVLFVLSAVVFSTLSILQFRSWNVSYVDSGYFEELLWNTLHGQFLRSNQFDHNFLGEHAQFILLVLLPLYALWPSMEWLTTLQSFAVAAGVFPVWHLAKEKWDDRRALWFVALYLFQPGLHFALAEVNYNTFRPETLLIPSALFGVYCMERERWGLALLCGFLLLSNREDMAIVTAAAGVYVAWKKRKILAGVAVCVVSLLYFLACIGILIPHFSSDSTYTRIGAFEGLGDTPAEVASTAAQHPGRVLGRLFRMENLLYLSYLLLPLGLACLGRIGLALTALPYVLIAMFATGSVFNTIYFHYHNAPFAILMAATPAGAAAIAASLANRFRVPMLRAENVVLTFALAAAITMTFFGSKIPLSLNFWFPPARPFHYSVLYERGPHEKLLAQARDLIPRESVVSATIFAATHFTHHKEIHLFPKNLDRADFLVVDVKARWSKTTKEWMRQNAEDGIEGFDPVWIEDGIFVFQRKPPAQP